MEAKSRLRNEANERGQQVRFTSLKNDTGLPPMLVLPLLPFPFCPPFCLLLSILFSPFSFLSLLPFPPFDMRACPPFRSTSSPSPSRFFYVPSVVPSPQARLPRGEHEPRTSRAVAQNLAGEFFPWKWLIERAPVQTRGYRGLFPLFCERLVLLLASLTLHAGPP